MTAPGGGIRGVAIPKGLLALGPDVGPALRQMIAEAERAQDRELREALAATLKAVPRPLRGVVRKVLGA